MDIDIYKSRHTADELEVAILSVFDNRPYAQGYLDGKQAEYDRFWDLLQNNGSRTDYSYAFSRVWTDGMFRPKYNIVAVGSAVQMFTYTRITNLATCLESAGVTLDVSGATNLSYLFNYAQSLTEVPHLDARSATNIGYMFNGCNNLKKASITFPENKLRSYSNVFSGCFELEEFTASGVIDVPLSFSDCSKLTDESVQSIINALKDLTGATTKTLTFHADVGGKLTAEQKAAITAKNWTLVY